MSDSTAVPEGTVFANRLLRREETKRWRLEKRAEAAAAALRGNDFEAVVVPDAAAARQAVLDRIGPDATVGVGGSMTIRETGVLDVLSERGQVVYDHWSSDLDAEEMLACRRAQLTSDVFLSSANALTLKGQLVACDGIGNRVAAMTFGPGKVVLVVGANKIVEDLDSALRRIRDVCAPLALKETAAPVPCVERGICGHCHSKSRLCRATLVLDCKPLQTDYCVMVVAEELGF